MVAPGARLAPEAPEHRAAHWVVVAGAATFTVNGDATNLAPGQSLDVPAGIETGIDNPGRVPARIVQVQCADPAGTADVPPAAEVHTRA